MTIENVRGDVFNVTKECRRFTQCEKIATETCEKIGDNTYCELCEVSTRTCRQRE